MPPQKNKGSRDVKPESRSENGKGRLSEKDLTHLDERASPNPVQHTSPSPRFQTASLCSSSSRSSEPYVSHRGSQNGSDTGEEATRPRCSSITSSAFGESNTRSVQAGRTQQHDTEKSAYPRHSQPAEPSLYNTPDIASDAYANANDVPHIAASSSSSASPSTPHLPPPPRTHFQYIHSFDYRCRLAAKMRALYGTQSIPVIVEPTESHLRGTLHSAPAYESKRLAAETRMRGADGGHGLLSRFVRHDASSRTSSAGASSSPALSSSAASALASPSTRSTLKCVLPGVKSVAEVILTLRDRLALDSCQSIFLSVGESDALVPGNSLLGDLYQRYHHLDGFLYMSYMLENTFG